MISHSTFFEYIQSIDDVISFAKKVSYGIIASYCLLAGAIAASPTPFLELYLLNPIQVSMIMAIAVAFGRVKNRGVQRIF